MWTQINVSAIEPGTLKIKFQWFQKTSTRLPEALWFTFKYGLDYSTHEYLSPVPQDGWSWTLHKLGEPVSPLDVVRNGSSHIHGIMEGVSYWNNHLQWFNIRSDDAAVVVPGELTAFPTPLTKPDLSKGMNFLLYNNLWYVYFCNECDQAGEPTISCGTRLTSLMQPLSFVSQYNCKFKQIEIALYLW